MRTFRTLLPLLPILYLVAACGNDGAELTWQGQRTSTGEFLRRASTAPGEWRTFHAALAAALPAVRADEGTLAATLAHAVDAVLAAPGPDLQAGWAGLLVAELGLETRSNVRAAVKARLLAKGDRVPRLFTMAPGEPRRAVFLELYLAAGFAGRKKGAAGGHLITAGLYDLVKRGAIAGRAACALVLRAALALADREEIVFTVKSLYGRYAWKKDEVSVPDEYLSAEQKKQQVKSGGEDYDRVLEILE